MRPAAERLPIRTISSLTGVNAITLRAWERRYGLLRPLRTPKGHRLYTHDDVELVRRVIALVERGVPISRARAVIESESVTRARERAHGPWREYFDSMAAAIARFDEPELDRVYDRAASIHSIANVTRHLVLPLLAHLGERWKDVAGGIAEEHFFANYLRARLAARLLHRARYAAGPCVVAACAPGEQHEIGLMLFVLEAHDAGVRAVMLGADTPLDDLAAAQRRTNARAIVISSTVDPPAGLLERDLAAFARKAGVPVFVGGQTAVRRRRAVEAAGAVAAGAEIEDGVRLILASLVRVRDKE